MPWKLCLTWLHVSSKLFVPVPPILFLFLLLSIVKSGFIYLYKISYCFYLVHVEVFLCILLYSLKLIKRFNQFIEDK